MLIDSGFAPVGVPLPVTPAAIEIALDALATPPTSGFGEVPAGAAVIDVQSALTPGTWLRRPAAARPLMAAPRTDILRHAAVVELGGHLLFGVGVFVASG